MPCLHSKQRDYSREYRGAIEAAEPWWHSSGLRTTRMFSAMLLAISILALSQFAIYYGRAVFTGVAAQPVSERVLQAAAMQDRCLTGEDFPKFAELHDLTPYLQRGGDGLGLVRHYYSVV